MQTDTIERAEHRKQIEEQAEGRYRKRQWDALLLALAEGGRSPKKNCKICQGRGIAGYNMNTRHYFPCKCTRTKMEGPTDSAILNRMKRMWSNR